MGDTLRFITESNGIENVRREPTKAEIEAHGTLWALAKIKIGDLRTFVSALGDTDDDALRSKKNMNVVVRVNGSCHYPPLGGQRVVDDLEHLLSKTESKNHHPYVIHQQYETLHPFMDGNGRSGRAIWAWQMINQHWDKRVRLKDGFLKTFYFQALDHGR